MRMEIKTKEKAMAGESGEIIKGILMGALIIFSLGTVFLVQGCGPVQRGEEVGIEGETGGEGGVAECPAVSYSNDIYPMLKQKCAGCHTSGPHGFLSSGNPSDDYSKIKALADEKEEQTGESELIAKATGKVQHGGGPLITEGSEEYTKLKCWIEQGAPNN